MLMLMTVSLITVDHGQIEKKKKKKSIKKVKRNKQF